MSQDAQRRKRLLDQTTIQLYKYPFVIKFGEGMKQDFFKITFIINENDDDDDDGEFQAVVQSISISPERISISSATDFLEFGRTVESAIMICLEKKIFVDEEWTPEVQGVYDNFIVDDVTEVLKKYVIKEQEKCVLMADEKQKEEQLILIEKMQALIDGIDSRK